MVHPPCRGTWWNGTRPCVHRGFLQSWTANDLNKRLISRIKDLISEAALNPKLPKFLVRLCALSFQAVHNETLQ